jgi:NNMT/PNMT/TEMT family
MTAKTHAAPEPPAGNCGNSDYAWAKFDSEAYFQHYYGDPHPDDDRVIRCAVAAMKRIPRNDHGLDIIDIGTGPNLIPFFCAFPRARSLTAWEYAESNVAWLEAELERPALRPQWTHFWNVTRAEYGDQWPLPENPTPHLKAITTITRGSVFDLPERRWDAATMFFCAESITEKPDEFTKAIAAFARCVKAGGALAAAVLVRSAGYEVSGRRFPVLNVTAETAEATFSQFATNVDAERIGIVEKEIRSGYSGFVFLTGLAL